MLQQANKNVRTATLEFGPELQAPGPKMPIDSMPAFWASTSLCQFCISNIRRAWISTRVTAAGQFDAAVELVHKHIIVPRLLIHELAVVVAAPIAAEDRQPAAIHQTEMSARKDAQRRHPIASHRQADQVGAALLRLANRSAESRPIASRRTASIRLASRKMVKRFDIEHIEFESGCCRSRAQARRNCDRSANTATGHRNCRPLAVPE